MFIAVAGLGLLIGIAIGGLGGGGGVLTVPVLVYLLGHTVQEATTSSVIIVGITAAAGVLTRLRDDVIDWRSGLAFGAVGIPAAALGTLLNQRVAPHVLLLCFAVLAVLAAVAMLLEDSRTESDDLLPSRATVRVDAAPQALLTAVKTVSCGLAIGFLTGFLGVGGGFLMVPALVIVMRMPIAYAAGTSLLIIVLNSTAALATRAGVAQIDWAVVIPFTVAAVVGSFAGKHLADRLSGPTLNIAFAVMLLLVGVGVGVESVLAW